MQGFFEADVPEEWRLHETMRIFGWTEDEYDATPARTVDWALEIEGAKQRVAETRRAAAERRRS